MGPTKYTPEMAKALRKVKKPVPFTLHVVEHSDGFTLRVFEDEVMSLPIGKRVDVINYLAECQKILNSFGLKCGIEGAKGGPRV